MVGSAHSQIVAQSRTTTAGRSTIVSELMQTMVDPASSGALIRGGPSPETVTRTATRTRRQTFRTVRQLVSAAKAADPRSLAGQPVPANGRPGSRLAASVRQANGHRRRPKPTRSDPLIRPARPIRRLDQTNPPRAGQGR